MQNYKIIFILLIAIIGCKKEKIAPKTIKSCLSFDEMVYFFGDTVHFTSCSQNSNRHQWDFGDGEQSSIANPTHVYHKPGTYRVEHYAYNSKNDMKYSSDTININRYRLDSIIVLPSNDSNNIFYCLGFASESEYYTNNEFDGDSIKNLFFYPKFEMIIPNESFTLVYFEQNPTYYFYEIIKKIKFEKTIYNILNKNTNRLVYDNDTLNFTIELNFTPVPK